MIADSAVFEMVYVRAADTRFVDSYQDIAIAMRRDRALIISYV